MTRKNARTLAVLLLLPLIVADVLKAQTPPKREFRAAWIPTVTNLDWPGSNSQSSEV